jgi:trimeric autotransporter adhesin
LLVSATGTDSLVGIGSDTLVAGAGNDLLQSDGGSINVEFNAGFGNDTVISEGGTVNLLLGTGILATDFTGSVSFDSLGNSYLNLTGDGGSISIENGLTGNLASAAYADPSSIPLSALLTDTFGGDQTVAASNGNLILNLANNESLTAGALEDTISSWGNSVTLTGGSSGYAEVIDANGSAASIVSGYGNDSITATGANDTISGGTSAADHISVKGANALVTTTSQSDSITASGNNDTLNATSGNSRFYINNTSTVIQLTGSALDDIVFASVSYTAPTNINILALTGSANIVGTGNASADTLTGGAGADTLVAGVGAATLVGGTGNTTFVVNSVSDAVQDGSATASNTLSSSVSYSLPTNVNTLVLTGTSALTGTANNGNDTLTSNAGVDTLIGGAGNDTFILNNANDVVLDSAGTATIVYAASAVNFTLPANVTTLMLTGTTAIDATGNAGNDLIAANVAADTLVAGSGTDTLISSATGPAIDSLVGGTGNDLFVVNYTGDLVTVGGTHGIDTIESSVSYSTPANIANLTLIGSGNISGTGNSLASVLTANGGNDTLTAGTGIATLMGGSGNDLFVVNSASDVVQVSATTTNDTISSSVSYSLPTNVNTLLLTGLASLTGWANNGNDTLVSNSGVDTLVGGTGNDAFLINNSGDIVQDTSTSATNTIVSSVTYSLPTNINTLTLTGTAALSATGNAGNDLIAANTGADTLVAGSGADTLISSATGTAVDSLVGGSGSDLFVVNYASDIVTVGTSLGADTIQASVSYTLPMNVNTLTLTGTSNLVGVALAGNNSIVGNAGSDTLRAGSGGDTLVAGSGVDTLVGGSGADTFVINNAADVLQSISGVAGNAVVSSVSYSMATNISILTLAGTGNLTATGNGASDTITANSGSDTLIAGSGIASLVGGLGSDLFVINNVGDVVSDPYYGEKTPLDTISSSVSYALPGTVTVLLLGGSANLSGTGNSYADSIVGNAGQDTLVAGTGSDTLVAGSGVTTLVGGAGSDTFVINSTADVVQDSITGQNNLLLSSVGVTLPTNVNALILTGSANLLATANSGDDSMTGNAGTDTLVAGVGADTLVAGGGLDALIGGAGNDTFVVNNSLDTIQSASASTENAVVSSLSYVLPTNVNALTLTGTANITGTGNSAADTLTAGGGQDTLIAGSGVATLVGGIGNDTFVVNNSLDVVVDAQAWANNSVQANVNYVLPSNVNSLVLTGTTALNGTANSGNDTLTSNAGLDTLVAGAGNDTFVISNSGDVVQDTVTTTSNTAQASVSYSLAANVNTLVLTGTASLTGSANAGNDTLVSNSGVDTLVGGAGTDTFVIGNASDVVSDAFTSTSNSILSSVSYSLPVNVNVLTLGGTAALMATGNAASDRMTANSGNDTLVAGSGVATLVGGTGNDLFIVNSASDVVQVSSTSASDTIQTSVSYSLAANVNTLVLTGTVGLTGSANGGNDTLTSNSGVDTLVGGSGNDVFIVNNASDVIQNATSSDTIESSVSFTLSANVNNLILIGSANISGTGNANSDVLTAGAGTDTLIAGAGVATLIGGTGNDAFVVNNSADVVQNGSTTTSDTIQSSVTFSLPSNVDSLTLTGSANLTATGNTDANNVLAANSGNDLLVGTAFSTTINGGIGSDTILAGPESNLIYAGNGGTALQPTGVIGNANGTNVTTQSTIYGGTGTDVLYGGPGSDVIYAGTGTDSIYAGTGFDSIYGGSGDLLVDNSSGYDLIVAGGGPESISGMGQDTLVADTGADLLDYAAGPSATSLAEFNSGFGHDTIGAVGSNGVNLLFGTGIEPGNLSITAQVGTGNVQTALQLVINDGSGSIIVPGGLYPGTIGTITFADTGPESLTQLMNLDGPGTITIPYSSNDYVVSTGNGHSITTDSGNVAVYAYGSSDSISGTATFGNLYAFGNNDTISTVSNVNVLAQGNSDLITLGVAGVATLVGGTETVVGAGSNYYVVDQSSTVIQEAAGATGDSIDAYASYSLPTNVQALTLYGDSLTASSNSQGGTLTATGNFDSLAGGAGVDSLVALDNSDSIIGGSGAETYVLHSSTDIVLFGSGNASLNSVQAYFNYTLAGGANTLTIESSSLVGAGDSGNDSLVATGNDTLVAGSGTDTLNAAGGSYFGQSTLIGGSGNDTFIVINPNDVIVDTATTTTNTLVSACTFTLPTNVNTLNLTGQNVVGTANSGNDYMTDTYPYGGNTLVGGGGNDTLVAAGGGDQLIAGTGQDVLQDNAQSSHTTFVFNTGFGHDQIVNALDGDVIQFGSGITESSLTFTALAGAGGAAPSLVISGAGGAITVQGGLAAGAISSINFTGGSNYTLEQLLDPSGRVTVPGASGNLILTSSNADSLTAGSGQDTVIAWGNNDTLTAGSGGTLIYAEGTGDRVAGGGATDSLVGYAASNTLVGGSGNETFIVSDPSTVINVSAGVGHDTVLSSVSYTVPNNVSVLTLTGNLSLTATGNAGSDLITGNSAGDIFIDGAGADTFVGNANIVGYPDTFYVNNTNDVVRVSSSLPGGDGAIYSTANYTLPTNVDALILNASNIVGTGNSQNDNLVIGNNSYNDTLISGSGIDQISANANGSLIVINNSADAISALGSVDTIQSAVSATLGGGSASYFGGNFWNLTGSASIVADFQNNAGIQITGNSGNDTLIGADGGGNTLVAGVGIDTLIGGGAGAANVFVINNAADAIVAPVDAASSIVNSTASYTLPTNVSQLTLKAANLVATGNSPNGGALYAYGADTLSAGSGNETLYSAKGHGVNTLVAGAGTDVLSAYAGDTLLFNTGFGNSEVQINSGGSGLPTVEFGSGVSAGSLTASAVIDSTGHAALAISSGTTAVTLDGTLSNYTYQFNFYGGSTLTLAQFLAQVNVTTSSVAGSSGNVILEGTASTAVTGGAGNDTIYAAATGDTITGGSGVQVLDALGTNDLVIGGSNNDTLGGFGTNDTLTAGPASDVLIGGTGASVTFVINSTGNTIQLQSSPGADTVRSSVAFSLPTGINTLVLTGTSSIKGTANNGSDTLLSNSGSLDTLAGGTGADLFVVSSSTDVVSVGGTHGVDTIQSGVNYTNAANVAYLVLTGTSALTGTGTTTASQITANSGADTLSAGTAVVTLVGGAGNDTFVINSTSDIVQDTVTTTSDVLSSSVSYTLPTNINRLILTGTAALVGTANSANDTLTANTGADTLVSGTGVDSLVGGTGANLFVVNNASDIVNVGSTHGVDTIQSSVSYTASANVANLTLTGTAALLGTGNSLAGTITANTGNDTLTAGSGADTLVGGSTGTDLFVVNSASDVVKLGTSGTSDTIQSSASYTLPTNVQYLTLSGTSALAGTGNNLLDLIVGDTGSDTLTGGTGIAALEGGRTAGSDQIKASSNQAALIGGAGASTLTGGAFKDFYAAGKVSDSITTGATANVISVNKGDGATALQPTTSATNVLSLGAGIDTESLFFTKTGNNLILTDGVSGDSISFTNWYVGSADQTTKTLQVVEIASANYNSGGGDALRNKALEDFNFTSLVAAYNTAGSPANWALSSAMPSAQLASSSTADYGGDLAYYFGLNGNLTGVNLSAVQSTLTNASFGTAAQTIDGFSSISGGGLHLLAVRSGAPNIQPISLPPAFASALPSTTQSSTPVVATTDPRIASHGHRPEGRDGGALSDTALRAITPRRGIEVPRGDAVRLGSYTSVSAASAASVVAGPRARETIEPVATRSTSAPDTKSYVDPVNVAWLRMHSALNASSEVRIGGAESAAAHEEIATDALLGSAPLERLRRAIGGPENSLFGRRRAM